MSGSVGNPFVGMLRGLMGGQQAQGATSAPPPPPAADPRDLQVHMAMTAIAEMDQRRRAAIAKVPNQFSLSRQMAERVATGEQMVSQMSGASSAPAWLRGNGGGGFG